MLPSVSSSIGGSNSLSVRVCRRPCTCCVITLPRYPCVVCAKTTTTQLRSQNLISNCTAASADVWLSVPTGEMGNSNFVQYNFPNSNLFSVLSNLFNISNKLIYTHVHLNKFLNSNWHFVLIEFQTRTREDTVLFISSMNIIHSDLVQISLFHWFIMLSARSDQSAI